MIHEAHLADDLLQAYFTDAPERFNYQITTTDTTAYLQLLEGTLDFTKDETIAAVMLTLGISEGVEGSCTSSLPTDGIELDLVINLKTIDPWSALINGRIETLNDPGLKCNCKPGIKCKCRNGDTVGI